MKTFVGLLVLVAAICMATCQRGPPRGPPRGRPMRRIVQLCESELTLDCVRNYFSENSNGEVVSEEHDPPVAEENLPFYLPNLGLEVITTSTQLSNMNGEIQEFYQDTSSGNVVLSVKFEGLQCYAPGTIFAFARDGLEPKVFTDDVTVHYPATLTAVIPSSNGINEESLRNGHYFASFDTPNAIFELGPKFLGSDDPVVQAALNGLAANVPLAVREIFETKSQYYFLAYLQSHIANFDLPLRFEEYDATVLLSLNDIETDDPEDFEMPCEGDDITACVQEYFGQQGSCPAPSNDDPVLRKREFSAYIPGLGVIAETHDTKLSVANGNIVKFYRNTETNNIVVTVDFADGIVLDSSKLDLVIDRSGKQPRIVRDSVVATYPVKMTATIPSGNGLNAAALDSVYVSTLFTGTPTFELGPRLTNPSDPELAEIIDNLHEDSLVNAQQIFATEGRSMFLAYFQSVLCDFDVSLL